MGHRALAVFVGLACFLGSSMGADAGSSARAAWRAAEQANLSLINAPAAWQAGTDCSGAVVAVLDSGVDASNPHLAGSVLPGWNVLTRSSNTTDTAGHGTKVAGVIAGHDGLSGICRGARILPVVVWSKDVKPTPASIAAGITWAADHGATVMNLSLAGAERNAVLRRAIAAAVAKNIVIVAAAGNSGSDTPEYPAAYPGVVAVSGTDSAGSLASFSSFGNWVGLAAPAVQVLSTTTGGGIVPSDGTSFAAPLVAAAAAVVRTRHPDWTRAQVVRQLEQTAADAGPTGLDPAFGYGILDLGAAVGATSPARPAGRLEPNDVPAAAVPLAIGSKLGAKLLPEGAVDWYAVDVAAPTEIALVASPSRNSISESTSLIVDTFGPNLRLLVHRDARWDSSGGRLSVSFPAAVPGHYFVRIANAYGSRGAYRLSVGRAPLSRWAAWEDIYTGAEGSAVAVGDVTGDGRADVLMTTTAFSSSPYAGQLLLFAQHADGTLGAPQVLPRGARFCCGDVTVGDLNGDGRLDVAATLGSYGVETFIQKDGRLVGPKVIPTTSAATGVRIRNGNLVVTEVDGVHLLRHDRSGFSDERIGAVSTRAAPPTPKVTADIDGDGRPDIVLGNTIHYASGAVESDGCDQVGIGADTLAAGDINGDGKIDLVWAGPFGLVVVRQRSGWSEPGPWVADASATAVRFARPVDSASLTARGGPPRCARKPHRRDALVRRRNEHSQPARVLAAPSRRVPDPHQRHPRHRGERNDLSVHGRCVAPFSSHPVSDTSGVRHSTA